MRYSCSVVLLLLFAFQASLHAERCAATPEAAAKSAIGTRTEESPAGGGYRVDEVQVDTVLHRAWVRVVRCGDSSVPAVLVPISAPMHRVGLASAAGPALLPPPVVIHFGDVVRAIYNSASVRMEMDAVAMQQGSVGETIALTLKRRDDKSADEPEQRIHGIVRADKIVEVTP